MLRLRVLVSYFVVVGLLVAGSVTAAMGVAMAAPMTVDQPHAASSLAAAISKCPVQNSGVGWCGSGGCVTCAQIARSEPDKTTFDDRPLASRVAARPQAPVFGRDAGVDPDPPRPTS